MLARDATAPDAAQREQLGAWEAALTSSGLPVAGLDAAKRRARFAVAAPLAAAIPGEGELIDVWLVDRLPAWRVREALAACIPSGWHLVDTYDVWLGEPALPGRVVASVYRASLPPGSVPAATLARAALELLGSPELPRERRKGETSVAYDLRPFLDDLTVEEAPGDGSLIVRMTLRHDPEKGIGRPEEALAALGERLGAALEPVALVRERLVLGAPPPSSRPAPGRRMVRQGPGSIPSSVPDRQDADGQGRRSAAKRPAP